MKVFAGLPNDNLNAIPETVRGLEAAGYNGVAVAENKHDPFLPLAVGAVNSSQLELATGITIAFARSPMVVANLSWDLQRASKGRFTLGLGSQVKGHNVRRFSVPWSAPAPRLREYCESLRAIWHAWRTGEALDYIGEHYQFTLMTPNFTPEPMDFATPPITIAAVGPVMMRLAGEVCDGVRLHGFCTRAYIENVVMPRIDKGLSASGRERANFEVSGGGFVATGATDEEVQKQFEWIRQRVGFYGSTRAYWPVFEQHDLLDLGEKLNHMSKTNQWEAMTAEIDDDIVHLFAAVGRFDELASAVEKRFGGVADVVSVTAAAQEFGAVPPDLVQDLQRIASAFDRFATP